MVRVVPIARATFDRCGVVLGTSATLPEAPGRCSYRALGLRGVLMIRGVFLSGRWFTGGRARSRFCVGWDFVSVGEIRVLTDRSYRAREPQLSHSGRIHEKKEPGTNPDSLLLLRWCRRRDLNPHGFPHHAKKNS
jgi:hypothetical protein